MRRRSTSRLSRSTTGVGVRSRQHVVSLIRVTDKLHGRVQVSEMTRKGFPAYRRACLPFSQHVVHEVHHVASSNRDTVVNELPAFLPGVVGSAFSFSNSSRTLFFIVLGVLSTISLSSRPDTAGDGSTVVGGSTVGAYPGGLTIDTRTGCCFRCSSMVLYRSNS